MSLQDKLEKAGSLSNYMINKTNYIENNNETNNIIHELNVGSLNIIKNQPFKDYINTPRYLALKESIKKVGITNPIIVRKTSQKDNTYDILSGRHRYLIAKELNIKEIPCIIKENISEDEANLILIDSNLCQREKILPSELAFSYKAKLEILNRRGLRSDLSNGVDKGIKSIEKLSIEVGASVSEIQRLCRMTYLIKPLLEKLDLGKLNKSSAYNISFLKQSEQEIVYKLLYCDNMKINRKMFIELKEASAKAQVPLDEVAITNILVENEILNDCVIKNTTTFKEVRKRLSKYFDENQNNDEILNIIEQSLKQFFEVK